jgi:hypothetical protein
MYFLGGKHIRASVGEQQVCLMEDYLFRTRILQEKFIGRGTLDGCTLGLPDLKITKVFTSNEKNSVSNSIICEGIAHEEEVIVKISFERIDGEDVDNSLEIERSVYEMVAKDFAKYTPNVMPFLANGVCDIFEVSLNNILETSELPKEIVYNIREAMENNVQLKEGYDLDKAKLLVTKKGKGIKLVEFMLSNELPTGTVVLESFMKDILLQIAYTLVVFEDLGLMHHDLHPGNVFVEKLSTPLHFSVDVGEITVVRDINYFVQIYDFDRATKVETDFNKIVLKNIYLDKKRCLPYNECNKFEKKKDWFTILHWLYINAKDNNLILPIVSTLVDTDLMNNFGLADIGRPCLRTDDHNLCTPVDLTLDRTIVSPYKYILNNYEKNTKKNCVPAFSRPAHQHSPAQRTSN